MLRSTISVSRILRIATLELCTTSVSGEAAVLLCAARSGCIGLCEFGQFVRHTHREKSDSILGKCAVIRRIRVGLSLGSERLSGLPLVSPLNVVLTMHRR